MPSKYSHLLWLSFWSLLIGCFVSLSLQADEFSLMPNTCAVTAENPVCDLALVIEYQSETPQSLCLWLTAKTVALTCFENRLHFTYQLQLTLADDTQFELRDPKNNNTLRSAFVKVAKFEPAKSRKRRGLHWNLL